MTSLTLSLVSAGLGMALMFWLMQDSECSECNAKAKELDRLQASNDSLLHALGNWISRADRAETVVRDLLMESAENKHHSFEIISERAKAIEDAKVKCGPDFKHIVGTCADPVYLARPDIRHDDIAYVATISELTK